MYREHHAFVWRCVKRLGVDESTEDAVQEVFVTAYRRLSTFEGRGSMRGWLAGIARKVAFRIRRTDERRHRRHDALAAVPRPVDGIEDWLRRREADVFLGAFLEELDPDKRSVFVLYELEGLPGREVAAALKINPNTAHARLRAARVLFQRACTEAQLDANALDRNALAIVHRREQAPEGSMKRSWAAVVTATGWKATSGAALASAPTGMAALLGQLKVAAITVAVGGAGIAVAHEVVQSEEPPATGEPDPSERSAPRVANVSASQPRPAHPERADAPAAVQPHPARAGSAAELGAALPTKPAPRATPRSSATALPSPAASPAGSAAERDSRGAATPASTSTSEAPDGDVLTAREYELLARAQKAQGDERWEDAARSAQTLLASYPRSTLASEASLLRVKALCRLGDSAGAREAAARLGAGQRDRILHKYCER